MTSGESLARELEKYDCICYYPSAGIDLTNLDYFCSGRKPWQERIDSAQCGNKITDSASRSACDPDLFIHTDINFYSEYEAGADFDPSDSGIYGDFEVLEFRELPTLKEPNLICRNFAHSGRCFEYRLRIRKSEKIRTLIYCLCENEFFVAKILLANNISVPIIWSRDWFGGDAYGTWLANAMDRLNTCKIFTDWLCVPGKRGEPSNQAVKEKYPELMTASKVKLVRNDDIHWIDEGAHGWVEEFDVKISD